MSAAYLVLGYTSCSLPFFRKYQSIDNQPAHIHSTLYTGWLVSWLRNEMRATVSLHVLARRRLNLAVT